MGNGYGEDDAMRRRTFYGMQSTTRDMRPRKLSCYITKNHLLVKEATQEKLRRLQWQPYQEEFKLSKFKNAVGKVDHRRDVDPFAGRSSVAKNNSSKNNERPPSAHQQESHNPEEA